MIPIVDMETGVEVTSLNSILSRVAAQDTACFLGTIETSIRALWRSGNKITAIRLLRAVTPLGITEARGACEMIVG